MIESCEQPIDISQVARKHDAARLNGYPVTITTSDCRVTSGKRGLVEVGTDWLFLASMKRLMEYQEMLTRRDVMIAEAGQRRYCGWS